MVLNIGSFWISINMLRDVSGQISNCWEYPWTSFPRCGKNGPFMAKRWSSHCPKNLFFVNHNQFAQGCPLPNFTLLGVSFSPLPRNGQNMIWMIYLLENFVEIPGILVQYLHFIRIILFVLQSASWLTSLLKLGKYRDVSCPGWDIFFKYFGDLPGMFFTLFLKIKIFLYVCLSVSWLTSLLKLGQYRDISSSRRVILLIFCWRYSLNVFTLF